MRANNQRKIREKKPFANKIQNYEMTINNNKDKKIVVYHKSTSDRGALTMMCGKNEEPWPSVVAHWRIAMACASYTIMDTLCQ